MQAYYGVPCPPRDAIEASLAGRPAGTEILVVEDGADLAGFAAFSAIYPGPGWPAASFSRSCSSAPATAAPATAAPWCGRWRRRLWRAG